MDSKERVTMLQEKSWHDSRLEPKLEIRTRTAAREPKTALAKEFNVSRG
jgi:hypothetical protein